jgi:hypothetical protein
MFWMTAFLDLAPGDVDADVDHWRRVTGYDLSPWRGSEDEFASLLPPEADDHLRVQRLGRGANRLHLDLHVEEPRAAARAAESRGASIVAEPGHVVMSSPGGFPFCFVTHPASRAASPATWPGGVRSVVDQVCLDIPSSSYDEECAFWEATTGWELRVSRDHEEFRRLIRPEGQPLQLLLQRLGEREGRVRAHLDLATTDRTAETHRHVDLGAEVLEVRAGWTVLADAAGLHYCITDRRPETRVLDELPPS